MRAVYLGLAAEVDHHIGRLLQYLKDRGRYEDTLIVVTADHGEMLGDQFLWGKQAPLDAALHIPLIVRDPAHQPMRGQIINAFTESVDIAPTLMEWARGDTVPAFNGRSLMPWLRGESVNDWRSFVFAEAELGEPDEPTHYQRHLNLSMQQSNFAVYREQHYKYVHFNGGIAPMLFDLLEDPHENSNLADDPSHQSTLQSMMSKMIDHRMSYADHALSGMKIRPSGLYTP
jgi:arylsulfatase A-like enzyme